MIINLINFIFIGVIREVFKKKKGVGGKIQSSSHTHKKKSFRTHFLLGEKRGVPLNFMNFEDFSKYLAILGGKRKKKFFARSA